MKKLFPLNEHQNNYKNWLYLGNNGSQDFYYRESEHACNQSGLWLSIVFSNDAPDYASPCIDQLRKNEDYYLTSELTGYADLISLLKEKGLF